MTDSAIIFDEVVSTNGKRIGHVTLNNTSALNALTLDMLEPLHKRLTAWDADAEIAAIFIDASGDKAFCAGGNIVALYKGMTGQGDPDYPDRFFTLEYRLCHAIHMLATPCIAWGHGLIMGGGMGVFSAASHRIVTASSTLAMPEIKIGLFPDCAATWFFNRLPGRLGLFVALTGATLSAQDALIAGLADRAINHEFKNKLFDALTRITDWNQPHAAVDRVLRQYAREHPAGLGESKLVEHAMTIREATDAATLAGIVAGIRKLAEADDTWLVEAATNLDGGCPVTAHLIYRQLRDGRYLSLKQAVMRELKMALQCCRHPDFAEGVRALLVDKDRAPQWIFESVSAVPSDYVDAHFRAPWDGDHPLRDLPDVKP
jgi:enoyl-CoA hydratase/carnithine racemase